MYKTINGWTKASMIEKLKKEFKGKAINPEHMESGTCAYLTPDGKKCAVGCFIPDGNPAQHYDGGILAMKIFKSELFSGIVTHMPLKNEGLLEFQNFHDGKLCNKRESAQDQLDLLIDWVNTNVVDSDV